MRPARNKYREVQEEEKDKEKRNLSMRSPCKRQARARSFGWLMTMAVSRNNGRAQVTYIVTRLACIAARFVSSKRETRCLGIFLKRHHGRRLEAEVGLQETAWTLGDTP